MAKGISEAARDALAATDWRKIDALTDEAIAKQIGCQHFEAREQALASRLN